ncbi:MAG: peptidoglycan DD-metalloendopeptidase family protein [Clostridiales bacterium]|jgi:murein DD-endopeptidase MepM/ murein hydrolase activator NlpD|nr:peptidoglycan DD-metalloendopeptidase family protein [Clostridiales bacterium]
MKKIVLALVAVFSLVGNVYAESLQDMQSRKSDIQSQIDQTESKIEQTQNQKTQTEQEMEAMDAELTQVTDALFYVMDRLERANLDLETAEAELADSRAKRDSQYETLKERIKFMYQNGGVGYLDVIFGATSFTDFFNRVEYINRIAKHDQSLVSQLTVAEEHVNEKVAAAEKQRQLAEQLLYEEEQRQAELTAALEKKQELFNRLDGDEKTYSEKLAALEKSQKEIEALIKEKQQERQSIASVAGGYASATINTSPYNGAMHWPVNGYYNLSDTFRSRVNPINGRRENHAGIDIPAPTGTSILAAEDGVVITSGWKNGYGYTVIIDHGNGISTLYGHNSKLVASVGQSVTKGQVVSRCGSTGMSTGPHCHFEVRINGSPVNPTSYLG